MTDTKLSKPARVPPGTKVIGRSNGRFAGSILGRLSDLKAMPVEAIGAAIPKPCIDRLLLFNDTRWRGKATYVNPLRDLRDFRINSAADLELAPEKQSMRVKPFGIEMVYHVITDGDDFPGDQFDPQGLADLFKQMAELDVHLTEIHNAVRNIWLPYLLDIRKRPLYTLHAGDGTRRYFDLEDGELGTLSEDEQFTWSTNALHCIIVNHIENSDPDKITLGVADSEDIYDGSLDHPVFAVVISPDWLTKFRVARTIAHEAGHKFGLQHQNEHPDRLMAQSGFVTDWDNCVNVTDTDVELAHTHLAANNAHHSGFRKESL